MLHLVEESVYYLSVNLNTADGLTNSAYCTVMTINRSCNKPSGSVSVKFQEKNAGQTLRQNATLKNDDRSCTALSPVSHQFQAGYKGQEQEHILQYPLRPAAANMIYRAQGELSVR